MKKNLIERFQGFWGTLTTAEKKDLWNIMTALRGPDHDNDAVKVITTSRIRGELLGRKHSGLIRKKCFVYRSSRSNSIKKIIDPQGVFETSIFHFKFHTRDAVLALKKHVPKKRIRDLLNLL